jgi:hypothetical protein
LPVPPAVLTVSPKVVLEERAAVPHAPPVEFTKLVHVPLAGEQTPLAGPFEMLQLSVLVCPDCNMPGLAERVHAGGTPPLLLLDDVELDVVLELVLELLLELVLLPDG